MHEHATSALTQGGKYEFER